MAEPSQLNSLDEVEGQLSQLSIKPADKAQRDSIKLDPQEIDISATSKCPPIVLIAGDKREIRPFNNRYDIPGKFLLPAKIDKWVICVLFDDRIIRDVDKGLRLYDEINKFARRYFEHGRSKGVSINELDTIKYVPATPNADSTITTMPEEQLTIELREMMVQINDHLVDHAIIIIPDDCPYWVHSYLQYLEVTEWGKVKRPGKNLLARTSRVQYGTLMRVAIKSRDNGKHLIYNLWLKYNTKLGGVNVALKHTFDTHELKFLAERSLVLSIDLTHVVPADQADKSWKEVAKSLSVAAVVGMWNLSSAQMGFATQTSAQVGSVVVEHLDLLVRYVLRTYRERHNGQPPSHIIIFRSVTHEHNALEVAQHEISSIRKLLAAKFNEPDDKVPQLTYLRVPKRPKVTKNDLMQRNREVKTGSLVESLMTQAGDSTKQSAGPSAASESPSGGAPQAGPSHQEPGGPSERDHDAFINQRKVVKMFDERGLDEDQVRAMIHSLSYLSPRTTSKTRPTPTDLADLANERSRQLAAAWFMDHGDKFKDDMDQLLENLNSFLTVGMGDAKLRDLLYYA